MDDLRSFVTKVLLDIAWGIHDAVWQIPPTGAAINPPQPQQGQVRTVRFDVAVVAERQRAGDGGLAIRVLGLELGGSGETHMTDSQISRIQFEIPVRWPSKGSVAVAKESTEKSGT